MTEARASRQPGDATRTPTWWSRWSLLPRMLSAAPARVAVTLGVLIAALAMLIVARPLTSLVLLGIYVGVSSIASGFIEFRSASSWLGRVLAVAWIAVGALILVWLGRSLDLLPDALALLLALGGLASFGAAVRRMPASSRVLLVAWGAAQIVFAVLALTWPDVTVLVVAVVFGVRMFVFGVSLVVRGVRGLLAPRPSGDAPPRRARRAFVAAGRYALSVLLVVSAAAGWWLNDWLAQGAPVVDAFYDAPDSVPSDHGRLIRSDAYDGVAPKGGSVQRILYTTRDAIGRPAVASGLVIVPTAPSPAPRPVVLWNHGTTGVAQGCAPSLRADAATRWAIPALEEALARGWVVVASDYSGQGADGDFPYLIGKGEAQSSLDAVLAVRDLPAAPWLSKDVVVWGHSQGGHAALWTEPVAEEYAPDLRVTGTAALSPVSDPVALADELLSGRGDAILSVLVSWVLVPYADTYPEVDLRDYVAPGARTIVREMTQRCPNEPGVVVSVVTALGVSEDRPLYTSDVTQGALGRRLEQNAAVGPWTQPVLVTWGASDEVIPPRLQQQFVESACAAGNQVRWVVLEGYNHQRVLQPRSPFLPTLIRWTEARFGGAPVPSDDCRRFGVID